MIDFLKSIFGINSRLPQEKPKATYAVDGHGDVHEVKKISVKEQSKIVKRLTKKDLNNMTKTQIVEAGLENLNVTLNIKSQKPVLIQSYMEAQRAN